MMLCQDLKPPVEPGAPWTATNLSYMDRIDSQSNLPQQQDLAADLTPEQIYGRVSTTIPSKIVIQQSFGRRLTAFKMMLEGSPIGA